MFIAKKIITSFLLPPGIIILLLVVIGILGWRRKQTWLSLSIILTAIVVWGISTGPLPDYLTEKLEKDIAIPSKHQGDVIILLGGGIKDGVQDLTGRGAPSDDMFGRIVTAVRLQKELRIPVIISGGSAFNGRTPEAVVVKRFLFDLGVPEQQIILEDKSRDTQENALYCREIIVRKGYAEPLLVTSAYHMRRSLIAFRKAGQKVTPFPAQFSSGGFEKARWGRYFPSSGDMSSTARALHEYLGILYYKGAGNW